MKAAVQGISRFDKVYSESEFQINLNLCLGQTECIHLLLDNGADDAIIDPINGMCAQGQSIVVVLQSPLL